ncbi:orotidine-5'-phosphate decarboxylase [Saliterribacillus persicus]|uniref:Orotidine 5'-phosphate decarboxylase n=1 Tax=Saliterribacillus persicus TaxID=930114 RepID=A0A368XS40_9BACI|nr:orotidine-5'-phosphate decarboxylase [Saliterribacillus persicus]RCW70773.1 orotidine-5'-phosphate decarboxylase [Saliterribacillus persicus]
MKQPFYLALDFKTLEEVQQFIKRNDFHGIPVKVGMELFYREGPKIIEWLRKNDHPIFLDLKLHDIPTTVRKAMANLSSLDIDVVNVHASGGQEMIKAAKEGLLSNTSLKKKPKLIGVTVLTSMDESCLHDELNIQESVSEAVVRLAKLTKYSGADGVVCSAYEAQMIKEACGKDFLTITPGIRLVESDNNDQKRVATPSFAKQNGCDFLVIGRSVTQAENPKIAYEKVIEEWNHA